MSITSIIQGKSFPELHNYLKENVPKKNQFVSSTGFPAFSKSIPAKILGTTTTSHETALVGQLADHVFCLEVLRFVEKDRLKNLKKYFRNIGLAYEVLLGYDRENAEKHRKCLADLETGCLEYVTGKKIKPEKLVAYANLLNKVEQFPHIRHEDRPLFWKEFGKPCKKNIVNDVSRLTEIFRESFLENGPIKKDSSIVLHAQLSVCTSPVGIADLYADGVLYDFKSTKRNGYCWTDVGQVYGYYILHKLSTTYARDRVFAEGIPIDDVKAIALYYSRFGDIEICSLKESNHRLSRDELTYLAEMMDEHAQMQHDTNQELMMKSFAETEWNKMARQRIKRTAPVRYTPETVGYAVGDTVYAHKHGKGIVLRFIKNDNSWLVAVGFESGQTLQGDINKVILVNWKIIKEDSLAQNFDCAFQATKFIK